MEFIKKNIVLIVGISIPILMILLVAGSIYLPGFFIKAKYNFLYMDGGDDYYYNQYQYSVQNEKLVRNEIQRPENQIPRPLYQTTREVKLFVHDVTKNESQQISFEDAQKLSLDPNNMSPDGFEIVYGSRSEGFFPFFFWSEGDYNTRYLSGHNVNKKLNLQSGARYNSFRFMGWIK